MAGKCLIFEGYLREQAVQHGFGATVELSKKAADWMRQARAADAPSMKLVPSQDLLVELRAAAVKEAVQSNSRCVRFCLPTFLLLSQLTCVTSVSTCGCQCLPSGLYVCPAVHNCKIAFPKTPLNWKWSFKVCVVIGCVELFTRFILVTPVLKSPPCQVGQNAGFTQWKVLIWSKWSFVF